MLKESVKNRTKNISVMDSIYYFDLLNEHINSFFFSVGFNPNEKKN